MSFSSRREETQASQLKPLLYAGGLVMAHVLAILFPLYSANKLAENKAAVLQQKETYSRSEEKSKPFLSVLTATEQPEPQPKTVLGQKIKKFGAFLFGTPEERLLSYLKAQLSPDEYRQTMAILSPLKQNPHPTEADFKKTFQAFMTQLSTKGVDSYNRERLVQNLDVISANFKSHKDHIYPAFDVPPKNLDTQSFYKALLIVSLLTLGGLGAYDLVKFPELRGLARAVGEILAAFGSWLH